MASWDEPINFDGYTDDLDPDTEEETYEDPPETDEDDYPVIYLSDDDDPHYYVPCDVFDQMRKEQVEYGDIVQLLQQIIGTQEQTNSRLRRLETKNGRCG